MTRLGRDLASVLIASGLTVTGCDGTPASVDSGATDTSHASGTTRSGTAGASTSSKSSSTTGGTSTTSHGSATGGRSGNGSLGNGGTPSAGGTRQSVTSGGAQSSGGASETSDPSELGGLPNTGTSKASGGSSSTRHDTRTSTKAEGGAGGKSSVGGAPASGGVSAGGTQSTGGTKAAGPVTTSCPGAVPSGITSVWCSCDQWGERDSGDYTYYNDIWGSGAGPQCIWLAGAGQWGVAAAHPNSSGIKSYPNVSLSPGKPISSITSYTSSFDVSVPNSGAYETTYDIWVKGTSSSRIEIMLWMNYHGAVQPIASAYNASGAAVADQSNVAVGGHTWNVYYGTNGSNDVVSLLRTSNTDSGTLDIKAILLWIIANNTSKYAKFSNTWTLDQFQFGFEITSCDAVQSFVTNSFSATSG